MRLMESKSPQLTIFIKAYFIRIKNKHRYEILYFMALLLIAPVIYLFKGDVNILYFGFGAGAILFVLFSMLFFIRALWIYSIFLRPKQDVYALSQDVLFKINGKRIIFLEDMYSFFSINAVNLRNYQKDGESRSLNVELYGYGIFFLHEMLVTSNIKYKLIHYSDECEESLQIVENFLNQTVLRSKRTKIQMLRLLLRYPMLIIFGVTFIILYVLSKWCG